MMLPSVSYRVTQDTADPLRSHQPILPAGPAPTYHLGTRWFVKAMRNKGLHPYTVPLASNRVPHCSFCQGFLCAKACKVDAYSACVKIAEQQDGATVVCDATVNAS